MKLERATQWRYLVEIVAVVSVVLSLAFVGYELRLNRSVADAEGLAYSRQLSANVNQLIIENSAVWTKGCAGDPLSSEEKAAFVNIVHAVDGQFLYQWGRSREGISVPRSAERATAIIALNMHRYPGFREAWMELTGLGTRTSPEALIFSQTVEELNIGFAAEVMEQYRKLQATPLIETPDLAYCGR